MKGNATGDSGSARGRYRHRATPSTRRPRRAIADTCSSEVLRPSVELAQARDDFGRALHGYDISGMFGTDPHLGDREHAVGQRVLVNERGSLRGGARSRRAPSWASAANGLLHGVERLSGGSREARGLPQSTWTSSGSVPSRRGASGRAVHRRARRTRHAGSCSESARSCRPQRTVAAPRASIADARRARTRRCDRRQAPSAREDREDDGKLLRQEGDRESDEPCEEPFERVSARQAPGRRDGKAEHDARRRKNAHPAGRLALERRLLRSRS